MADLTGWREAEALAQARGVEFGVIEVHVQAGRVQTIAVRQTWKREPDEGEVQLRG